MPTFQNKVYETEAAARQAITGDINLMSCSNCAFVFNASFQPSLMVYDRNYQNEQAYSGYFQAYLNDIVQLLLARGFGGSRVIEIGCGQGFFLNKLLANGFDAIGFDPAYSGDQPRIVKDYFSPKYNVGDVELIIMRHTLEHIPEPLQFLQDIASLVSDKAMVFIEVPDWDWIMTKRAFWDVVYEHCNYFNRQSLTAMFERSEWGSLFQSQYMYVIAKLSQLRPHAKTADSGGSVGFQELTDHLNLWKAHLQRHGTSLVWGAGAKGCNFVNLLDPNRELISAVIDINPMKQGRFIAKTGHNIIGPHELAQWDAQTIWVMNDIYLSEIRDMTRNLQFNIQTLELAY
ncbi:MAG: class I SAM-dependent methyltransferase [candidate division KSB1 bacterium]|nr:class I SAM-dependent methyltransferase [candidate division KSB1 bacterium]MDZ7317976.1 class I SAM-dependent methyltransferase [candidate division KSB1 bacterium]MDZ7340667.1 class I SAM-dependent methyltransferase [candidate division KSB1 bacterium]